MDVSAESRSPYPRPRGVRLMNRRGSDNFASPLIWFGAACGALLVGAGAGLWGRLCRVVVEGTSMTPTLAPHDRLVVLKLGKARPGDLVALRDPAEPDRLLVKRLRGVGPYGLDVRGDNPAASRDSRTFGPVDPSLLVGRAVYRYFPPSRACRLRRPASSSGTLARDGLASGGHRSPSRA